MSDSQGRDVNNDGVNPILRPETLATLKAGKIARNGVGTADGSGGTTAATATSTKASHHTLYLHRALTKYGVASREQTPVSYI